MGAKVGMACGRGAVLRERRIVSAQCMASTYMGDFHLKGKELRLK